MMSPDFTKNLSFLAVFLFVRSTKKISDFSGFSLITLIFFLLATVVKPFAIPIASIKLIEGSTTFITPGLLTSPKTVILKLSKTIFINGFEK